MQLDSISSYEMSQYCYPKQKNMRDHRESKILAHHSDKCFIKDEI